MAFADDRKPLTILMKDLPRRIKRELRPYRWLHYMLRNGHWLPEEMWSCRFSFSQFGEDIVLRTLLKDREKGFYVDVGAYDPIELSNTHLFYREGWRGINVEPNPERFTRFSEMRPEDTNLQIAVSTVEGALALDVKGAMSSVSQISDQTLPSSMIQVSSAPLAKILEENLPENTSISFLSIDCEGHDLEVLKSNNWRNPRFIPSVLLVEALGPRKSEILSFMLQLDEYFFYCRLGLTLFFVRKVEFPEYDSARCEVCMHPVINY